MSNSEPGFRRPHLLALLDRLREPRRRIQILTGPRQVGKTTLVRQALASLEEFGIPHAYGSADDVRGQDAVWLAALWTQARVLAGGASQGAVLAIDEVQKIPGWVDTVKRHWDEDTASGIALTVVLLGSAPLLVQRGLHESLAGRFEQIPVPHWSFGEMADAFGWGVDTYVYFGGYPGPRELIRDRSRWASYILDSIVETTVARDVLLMTRIDKPALLRQLSRVGCDYSGQILSYQKMVGQLQDAGNTTTLAHYLRLLSDAGLLTGLEKFSGSRVRQRGSSPKLLVLNTALLSAGLGETDEQARANPELWGRLVESAVGAHLVNLLRGTDVEVSYWREGSVEVDFVLAKGGRQVAIEVTSGRRKRSLPGIAAFQKRYPGSSPLLVGGQGIPVETFLRWRIDQIEAVLGVGIRHLHLGRDSTIDVVIDGHGRLSVSPEAWMRLNQTIEPAARWVLLLNSRADASTELERQSYDAAIDIGRRHLQQAGVNELTVKHADRDILDAIASRVARGF